MYMKEEVKDEIHFLYMCEKLQGERGDSLNVLIYTELALIDTRELEWTKVLLCKTRIQPFAEALEALYPARQDLLYKLNT